MSERATDISHSMRYFHAKLGKDGRITVPEFVRNVFHLKPGVRYVFFWHSKSTLQDIKSPPKDIEKEAPEDEG